MKIALAGASSTGKTTLVKELLNHDYIKGLNLIYVTTDARSLIKSKYNKQNIDLLSNSEFNEFQNIYFDKKIVEEAISKDFITDRSFADAYVYLSQRIENSSFNELKYKNANANYDFIIYLPFGVIPFENDGNRSTVITQHKMFAESLENKLAEWKCCVLKITQPEIEARVDQVINFLKGLF